MGNNEMTTLDTIFANATKAAATRTYTVYMVDIQGATVERRIEAVRVVQVGRVFAINGDPYPYAAPARIRNRDDCPGVPGVAKGHGGRQQKRNHTHELAVDLH